MLRRKVLRLATALGFVISSVAVAQDATTPPPAAPPPAAPPAAAPQSAVVGDQPAAAPAPKGDEERTEEIVVTGTRIKRKDLTTPAPVTVINRDQILASGKVSIGDFIQSLPEQGNGINTGVNNGGDGATRVNLRGIGVPRTLVLVNGRRWVPGGTGADSSVDLNSIPASTVERIEVLKDGGSALYGSDAIAGVVNIITKRSTNKTEATVLGGVSGQRDGQTLDLNLTTGTSSDRSSLLFSVGYFTQKKTMASDRSFSAIPRGYDGTVNQSYTAGSGTIKEGRTLVAGAGTTGNALWTSLVGAGGDSFIWDPGPAGPGYDGSTVFCGANGTGSTECFRKYAGAGLRDAGEVGDGYNFQPDNYLVTPQDRIQLFTTGDLKLADVARGYFEASYMNRKSGQDLASEPLNLDGEDIAVSAQNVYNPFGTDVFVRRRLAEFGRRTYTQDIDTFRVVTGLDGTLPEATGPAAGWFWDVNFNWGKTAAVQEKKGNLFTTPLAQALGPSFRSGNGPDGVAGTADDVYSCGTTTAPIDGCVPLNLFGGPGSITQDQVKGLTFTGTSHGTNELWSIQANTSGELFKLLADRPVGLAAGYEHRDLSGTFINDPITDKGLVTGNKTTDTAGSYYVDEIYGELSVPIVSNLPLAQDLEVTGAVRWFDYSTFGSDATYKIGGRWRPIGDVTVRGTYSTAFRAPSISELYLGKADNFPSVKDPCRGPAQGGQPLTPGTPLGDACLAQGVPAAGSGDPSAQLRSTNGGNADLKPETAKVYTVGLVIEPRWVRNLSVTLDYYNMDIDKNIGTVGTNVTLAGCYNGTNSGYCSNVIRSPATHFIDNIMDLNVNVGKMVTSGLDFAVRYALPTPQFGRFGVILNANWLEKVNQTLADGRVVKGKGTFDLNSLQGNQGVGGTFPEWKFNLGVTWGMGGLGAGISTRYLGSFKECGDSTGDFSGAGLCYEDATYSRTVHSYHAEDAFVSYDLASRAGKTSLMVGVNNLSNAPPALIYNGFLAQTDPYNYDVMGRFFYIRLAQAY